MISRCDYEQGLMWVRGQEDGRRAGDHQINEPELTSGYTNRCTHVPVRYCGSTIWSGVLLALVNGK
jgi:hypothetical protein